MLTLLRGLQEAPDSLEGTSRNAAMSLSEALRLAILSPLQVEGVDAATTPPGSIGAAFFNYVEDAFNILYLEKGNLDIVEQLLKANPAIQMRCSTVDRSQTIACIVVSHFKLRQINLSCVTVRGD